MSGILYIISSPIGNMEDITIRAIKILQGEVQYIFCEDTRRTKKLLHHYNIRIKTYSIHEHSLATKIEYAIKLLRNGNSIAYLTDSGTPGLSDPGGKLVSRARENKIQIVPIPGASALTSIISVSGFPGQNIFFAGFLSKKEGKRKKELERLMDYKGVIVIFESPYRIKKSLKTISDVFPECDIVIGREMTKLHEEFIIGKAKDIFSNIQNIRELGEFTIAINRAK
ncbi:MAG: 16S rRNA (cytidine(1402)-2'-O)-methyltransferase [Spirochaetota bacterium]|nr:16S rRNA (cytidine(1402)-2'-O)-methyltransferase [Spirochaetota bacterium]